jgi:hypothetical protein
MDSQKSPPSNGSPTSNGEHDDFLNGLGNVDAQLGQEKNEDDLGKAMAGTPIEPEHIPPPQPGYFQKVLPSIVAGALDISKKAGWKSPAVENLLTEAQWVEQVSGAAIHTLEKHFPEASTEYDSEIVLISLVVPWFVVNLYETVTRIAREKREGKKTNYEETRSENAGETTAAARDTPAGTHLGRDRNRQDDLAASHLRE